MQINELTHAVIGAAMQVHRTIGPGLLESAYQHCLEYELARRKIRFRRLVPLPVRYGEVHIDAGYQLDFVVEEKVIVELKSVERIARIHQAQLLTYLRLSGLQVGLLINFNVPFFPDGIHRIVNNFEEPL